MERGECVGGDGIDKADPEEAHFKSVSKRTALSDPGEGGAIAS